MQFNAAKTTTCRNSMLLPARARLGFAFVLPLMAMMACNEPETPVGRAVDDAGEAVEDLADGPDSTVDQAREAMEDAAEDVTRAAQDAAKATEDAAHRTQQAVQDNDNE